MLTKVLLLSALLTQCVYSAPPQADGSVTKPKPSAPPSPPPKTTITTSVRTTTKTTTVRTSTTSKVKPPKPTPSSTKTKMPPPPPGKPTTTVTSPSSTITSAPSLSCTGGSTVKTTTDCTYPTVTYSYCYSEPPPITCPPSSYSSTIQYGHCATGTSCFPVDAPYLTTTCTPGSGLTPYSTRTVFSGTLAGGTTTVIRQVQCRCDTDFYYSYSYPSTGTDTGAVYCMPRTNCGNDMTTSFSTNSYCVTATEDSYCQTEPLSYPYCQCTAGTPVYPSGGPSPTGCA